MFTGMVEELGEVLDIEHSADSARLRIGGPLVTSDAGDGDSIAVNGVCLTAAEVADDRFAADVMGETLRRTTLGGLRAGDAVNLEPALRAYDRLGGHIVQGHVDGMGVVEAVVADGSSRLVRIQAPPALLRYVVEKGSIAVDGVSLTVTAVDERGFSVALVPETLGRTTLGSAAPERVVNLETDVLAKYVEKLVRPAEASPA